MKNFKFYLIILFAPFALANCGGSEVIDTSFNPELQFEIEKDIITRYLDENNLPEDTTELGVRLVVVEQGEGDFVQTGDLVSFNFIGRTLVENDEGNVDDSRFFDTSIFEFARDFLGIEEDNPIRYVPITYTYSEDGWTLTSLSGGADFVPGFRDGVTELLQVMRSGGRGDIIIPSAQGFGTQGSFGVLDPNEIIIFEILDVQILN